MEAKLDINEVAQFLEVNPQTLRRWDEKGVFRAHRESETAHRYYYEDDLVDFLSNNYKYLYRVANNWAFSSEPIEVPSKFYCADAFEFKSRLSSLINLLQKNNCPEELFSLVTSIIGEIGNNSFDHNIGSWPNLPGIFFGYSLNERKIILADRGQGILTTLKRARMSLDSDEEALKIAFTEILSGRTPENRGNGLKYVRKIVEANKMNLYFQSGDSIMFLGDKNRELNTIKTNQPLKGCFTILSY